jgi:DNA sulfur modification protein DndB
LSSIYQGTKALLSKKRTDSVTEDDKALARSFWSCVAIQIPDWQFAASRKANPSELRREFVHSHGIALHSLGLMGAALLKEHPHDWSTKLKHLESVDWSRRNTALWEGRALSSGRISKASNNIQLTASLLKKALGLPLSKEELYLEASHRRLKK